MTCAHATLTRVIGHSFFLPGVNSVIAEGIPAFAFYSSSQASQLQEISFAQTTTSPQGEQGCRLGPGHDVSRHAAREVHRLHQLTASS